MLQEAALFFPVLLLLTTTTAQDLSIKFATDCFTPNQVQGVCIEIQNCGKLFDQVARNNISTFPFIRASRCGPGNEDVKRPKVCCGPDIDYIKQEESLSPEAPQAGAASSATPSPPSGHSVLPKICGKQKIFLERRIFGGQEADIGEFPWLGRLVHYNRYNRTSLGCSGFLIHRRFLLTAAHCLIGKGVEHLGPLKNVILGVHNDTKARICIDQVCTDSPRTVDALSPIIHQQYDSNTHVHDIALIPLRDKINFTDFIKAICLPRISTQANLFTISGWGKTETDASSRTKLKVEIPRANHTTCAIRYKSLGVTITERQLCAGGESGQDSCSGDSGGPLMAMGDQDLWYAEGIISYGNSCGRQDWPGVYTYIPKYYDWIEDQIRNSTKILSRSA